MSENREETDRIVQTTGKAKDPDEELKIFKETYQDSYFFEELSSYEPLDWVNIPKPLQMAIVAIKKCLVSNNKNLVDISEKVHQMTRKYKTNFENIERNIFLLQDKVEKVQEVTSKNLEEMESKIGTDLLNFKTRINQDMDFKQKSVDGKVSYLEEQVFNVRKFVSTLIKPEEVDNRIKLATESMRERVKAEINEHYLKPEISLVNDSINAAKELNQQFHKDYQDFKSYNASRFQSTEATLAESTQKALSSVEDLHSIISLDIKAIQTQFNTQVEKNSKGIDALNISFHDINHKYYAEFQSISKEIEQQSALNNLINNEISLLKKEIKEFNEILNPGTEEQQLVPSASEKSEHDTIKPNINSGANIHISDHEIEKEIEIKKEKKTVKPKKSIPPIVRNMQAQERNQQASLDFSKKISQLQKYVDEQIQLFEDKFNYELNHFIRPLEKTLKEKILANDMDLVEIKQKLSWLPINLSQIQGKSPTEARIYTLEARLRSEENSRLESMNKLMKIITSMQYSSPMPDTDIYLPPLRALSVTHENTFSQDLGINSDGIRLNAESQLHKKSNVNSSFLNSSVDFTRRHMNYKNHSPKLINTKLNPF